MLEARDANQFEHLGADPPFSLCRISRHQSAGALLPPATQTGSDRPSIRAEVPAGGLDAVQASKLHDFRALLHT